MPENKKEQVLSVRDLDITFKTTAGKVHAIRGVNIDLYKGETVALVGESGSGKSVTMKAAMGILAQNAIVNSGSIQFSYHHADGSPETVDLLQKDKKWIRRHINGKRIAMVFQDPMTSLDPTMQIGKQIMEGMLWHFKMPKDQAYKKAVELLEEVGITCEEMKDKDTRKLIFTDEEHKLRFFLAKGPDVPTYVEYGAADIGIVGKDTILEEGRRLYEVLDLGYGKCRMCVCGPESARELLQHNQQIRVATKYPNIAKDYFYNRKHQTVEMIKLNGSIELAPIVGLSEVIVDIVETGSTLRENGLTVLEEVCPLSARMVVNQVSMRMENERITKLIQDLKGALV